MKKAFSLIELIIAVVVLSIVVTIAFKLFAWATWFFWVTLAVLILAVMILAATGYLDDALRKLSELMDKI